MSALLCFWKHHWFAPVRDKQGVLYEQYCVSCGHVEKVCE